MTTTPNKYTLYAAAAFLGVIVIGGIITFALSSDTTTEDVPNQQHAEQSAGSDSVLATDTPSWDFGTV